MKIEMRPLDLTSQSSSVVLSEPLLQTFQLGWNGKEIAKFRDNAYDSSEKCEKRPRVYGEMKYYNI